MLLKSAAVLRHNSTEIVVLVVVMALNGVGVQCCDSAAIVVLVVIMVLNSAAVQCCNSTAIAVLEENLALTTTRVQGCTGTSITAQYKLRIRNRLERQVYKPVKNCLYVFETSLPMKYKSNSGC